MLTSIAVAGAQVFENFTDVTSYSYDSASKEFVSYDTPDIASLKAQYVSDEGLAGSMFWEVSGYIIPHHVILLTGKKI